METLQDIHSNKDILIATSSYRFEGSSKKLNEPINLLNKIFNRIIEYEQENKYVESANHHLAENIFISLIKGETVILLSTQKVRDFIYHWKRETNRFHVSDKKYGLNYVNYLAAKNHKQNNLFKFMLVISNIYLNLT